MNMVFKFYWFALATLLSILAASESVYAQVTTLKPSDYVTSSDEFSAIEIPVFFATNRERIRKDLKNFKSYTSEVRQLPGLDYGLCRVIVPATEHLKHRISVMSERQIDALHWKFVKRSFRKKQFSSFTLVSTDSGTSTSAVDFIPFNKFVDEIDRTSPLKNLNELFSQVMDKNGNESELSAAKVQSLNNTILQRRRDNQLIVFVHGFNCALATAALRAAEFSVESGQPAVVFSWPAKTSKNPLIGYDRDFTHCQCSRLTFNNFLRRLDDAYGARAISLVGHSMGSHLLCWAISERLQYFAGGQALATSLEPLLKEEYKASRLNLEEAKSIDRYLIKRTHQADDNDFSFYPQQLGAVVFLSPDLDQRSFLADIIESKTQARRYLVFVSDADSALKLSKFHNGELRAGANVHGGWSVLYVDFAAVGQPPFGHNAPADQVISILNANAPAPGFFLTYMHTNAVKIQKCVPGIAMDWYPATIGDSQNSNTFCHLTTKWDSGKIFARAWINAIDDSAETKAKVFDQAQRLTGFRLLIRDGRTIKFDLSSTSNNYNKGISEYSWLSERDIDWDTYSQIIAWSPMFK